MKKYIQGAVLLLKESKTHQIPCFDIVIQIAVTLLIGY